MKLIIDIPEEYKALFDIEKCKSKFDSLATNEFGYVLRKAFENGTPLQKGHGRLIDADSIYQIVRPIEQSDAEWGMTAETAIRLMHDVFDKAPTIIEAERCE
jgi:hypothetical protein